MSTAANADQQEYWNTIAGPRWVGLAGFVEKRVQKVNDLLLARSAVAPGEKVIEVGCGTARNLIKIAQTYPQTELFGLDASDAMLESAEASLSRAGLTIADIDLVEINEAFAAQVIPSARQLKIDLDRVVGARPDGHVFAAENGHSCQISGGGRINDNAINAVIA